MSEAKEGSILWVPSQERREAANLTKYMAWLKENKDLKLGFYSDLWEWSTDNAADFWESLWEYFEIAHSKPYNQVLASDKMPGARWFTGAELNYAENVFRMATDKQPALKFQSEIRPLAEVSWAELTDRVSALAASFRKLGVGRGDRVVAYMPNIPETVIAFLATASLGAIWSSCSPDFGTRAVVDRFKQIEPKLLLAVDGYQYGGKPFDCIPAVHQLKDSLASLEQVVLVPYLDKEIKEGAVENALKWSDLVAEPEDLIFEQVPFDHPMWVVYSSGTTGMPKGLVHSQGGILMEFLKFETFHLDLHPGETFFWFSTTGWVMWNIVQGGLLTGATPLLFDGNPVYPSMDLLWEMAEKAEVNFFGTSAAFIHACLHEDLKPGKDHDLSKLKSMGSTGSPLSPEGFKWVYDEINSDIVLGSTSGGTDPCTGFLGPCVLLPVKSGELQCRCLGVKAEAWDPDGKPLTEDVGELVITVPMPSMPLYLWGDEDNERYLSSYFDTYPGIWRHGDFIRITRDGGGVILGRSDSTLNRQGVRMGSGDFYSVVEAMDEVVDSLIVGYKGGHGDYFMPLFVVLDEGLVMSPGLKEKINAKIRTDLSPRHIPDGIYAIPSVPRTLNQKKLEVPVIKVLSGTPVAEAVNLDSMANPESMEYFVKFSI